MATATDTANLAANLDLRLGQEAGGPVGSLAYMPYWQPYRTGRGPKERQGQPNAGDTPA